MGHLKRICKDAFSVAGAVQETFSSELFGAQGADFVRGGCILEHQIFRFAEMISRDRHSTSYDLASLFRGGRVSLDRWIGVSSAVNFPCLKEVSKNCFVFDVVKFKNWRSLVELLCFGCCQVQKMKRSRRIVSFLTLLSSKIEEVSQNCSFLMWSTSKNQEVSQKCCVFDVVNLEKWRSLVE